MGLLNKARKVEDTSETQVVSKPASSSVASQGMSINVSSIQRDIARILKFKAFQPSHRYWLETGNPDLNAALGSRLRGIPYGKIIELSGKESAGKTTITTILAGMAQRDMAAVGYIDLEDSRDGKWASKLGLDLNNVIQIYPKLLQSSGKKKKKQASVSEVAVHKMVTKMGVPSDLRLESAEMLFREAETAMRLLYERGAKKQFWFLDSVANIETEMVVEAGTDGQSMRTRLDRAMFLAMTLPRWAGLAANYNALIVLINQLRDKQGLVFGKPTYSPGGRALRHNCAVRAEVVPVSGGAIKSDTKRQIGVIGVIRNEKNKAGEESEQGCSCQFKVKWNISPAKIIFTPVSQ